MFLAFLTTLYSMVTVSEVWTIGSIVPAVFLDRSMIVICTPLSIIGLLPRARERIFSITLILTSC